MSPSALRMYIELYRSYVLRVYYPLQFYSFTVLQLFNFHFYFRLITQKKFYYIYNNLFFYYFSGTVHIKNSICKTVKGTHSDITKSCTLHFIHHSVFVATCHVSRLKNAVRNRLLFLIFTCIN